MAKSINQPHLIQVLVIIFPLEMVSADSGRRRATCNCPSTPMGVAPWHGVTSKLQYEETWMIETITNFWGLLW